MDEPAPSTNTLRPQWSALLLAEQQRCLQEGQPLSAEEIIRRYPQVANEPLLFVELILAEWLRRHDRGDPIERTEFADRVRAHAPLLHSLFDQLERPATAPAEDPSARGADPAAIPPGYDQPRLLVRGGMGVIYLAREKKLNRLVALKMLLNAEHTDGQQRSRFQQEAEAIARLRHPYVVQIHEVGEHQGKPYFALEYVPGGSLDARLAGIHNRRVRRPS